MKDLFERTVPLESMSSEEREKLRFVDESLARVVCEATRGQIFSLRYEKSAVSPCEAVFMKILAGDDVREVRVDVTADSPLAIVKDVMRGVERVFG